MGILDDAIREHLDLKRKHGAAEDELQRQEEEALGPARREVAPTQAQDTNGAGEPAAADASPAVVDEPLGETQAAEPPAEAQTDPAIEAAPPPAVEQPQAEPEPEPEPLPPEPDPEPVATEQEPEPEPPPLDPHYDSAGHLEPPVPAGDTPPRGFETLDEEVDELFAEDHPAEGEEAEESEKGEDEDVLQDTPDFLQETPEHDRLWFEQKPPRDFDFD